LKKKRTKLLEIVLDKFPTHVAKTDNKYKINQFVKVNGQLIYNDSIQRFTRNTVMQNMHRYLMDNIPTDVILTEESLYVKISYHIPINYATVSRRKKKDTQQYYLSWKPAPLDYEPTNDIDNIDLIWRKAILDALKVDIIKDDNMKYITDVKAGVRFVDNINSRFIKIRIYSKKQ
jgi:hypothetical protein